MPFAPEYVTNVLNDNFEDAKVLFLSPLMAIEYAHLVMLETRRIIAPEDARTLCKALLIAEPRNVTENVVQRDQRKAERERTECHDAELQGHAAVFPFAPGIAHEELRITVITMKPK